LLLQANSIFSIVNGLKMGLRVSNIIYLGLAFFLLCSGIMLAIVGGFMTDINSKYDENFNLLRIEANKAAEAADEALPCPLTEINKLPAANGCKTIATAGNDTANAYWQSVVCPYGGTDWLAFREADAKDTATCKATMEENMRSDMVIVGILSGMLVGGFSGMIYLTQRAIGTWRKDKGGTE